MAGKHVHIIGINYWPEQTGIAPYTTGLARGLSNRGWDVTVDCGMPHYPEWRLQPEYRGSLQRLETDGPIEVRRLWHHVPSRQTPVQRTFYEATFLGHSGLTPVRRQPDLILGVVPSLSGGIAARLKSIRHRTPFAVLFQDLMGNAADQSGMAGASRVAQTVKRLEAWVARGAHGVAIVSEGFRPHIEAMGVAPDRITHIPNWSHVRPPTADRAITRASLGWDGCEQIVLHAGNMGLKQGLEHVVRAAQVASSRRLPIRFVLLGDGNQRRHLESLARDCDAITFLDPVPSEDFMNVLAAADILLVNERASVVDMSLPSKLTSYFVAGRPVIAAVNPFGATAREVLRSGAGVTVVAEDPDALISTIMDLALNTERVQSLAAAGPRYAAANLGADKAVDRFENLFDEVIARHRHASGGRRVFSFSPRRFGRAAGSVSTTFTSKDGHVHG